MAPRRPAAAPLPPVAISEYDGVRSLHLGSIWIQGSMRIAQPDRIELEYVQRMLAAVVFEDVGLEPPEHRDNIRLPGVDIGGIGIQIDGHRCMNNR